MNKNFKNGVITIGIFIVAAGGLFAIRKVKGSVSEFKTETVVMAEKVDSEDNKYLKSKDILAVDKSQKLEGNWNCFYGWTDENNLLVQSTKGEGSSQRYELSLINVSTGTKKIIYSDNHFINGVISPDRSKILYNIIIHNEKNEKSEIIKNKVYDIKKDTLNELENIDKKFKGELWSSDSSKVFGRITEKYGEVGQKVNFALYDFNKGKTEYIEFNRNEKADYKDRGIFMSLFFPVISTDCEKIFFYAWDYETGDPGLYSIKVDDPNSLQIELKERIQDIQMFDDKTLIFSGSYLGAKGIFLFDIETKEVKNLIEGYIGKFYLSSDKKRIAYNNLEGFFENSKINSLCAAKIEGYEIKDNIEFYKYGNDHSKVLDLRIGRRMLWSHDNKKLLITRVDEGNKEDYIFYFK